MFITTRAKPTAIMITPNQKAGDRRWILLSHSYFGNIGSHDSHLFLSPVDLEKDSVFRFSNNSPLYHTLILELNLYVLAQESTGLEREGIPGKNTSQYCHPECKTKYTHDLLTSSLLIFS
jgi:hypothetical protein